MEIRLPQLKVDGALQALSRAAPGAVPRLIEALQVGQLIQARVTANPQPGLLRLQIGQTELTARSPVDIPRDTRLQLQVVSRLPLPELRILGRLQASRPAQQLLRDALARQLPPAESRQALQALAKTPLTPAQSSLVAEATRILDSAGLSQRQLSAPGLRQAVEHSGLFHEARLLTQGATGGGDTKARLLQLLARLTPTQQAPVAPDAAPASSRAAGTHPADALLARLGAVLEGTVARIQLHQAAALQGDDGQRQVWQIDLPILLAEEAHQLMLRIEREANAERADQSGWTVKLSFDFDSIGRLQSRIALSGTRVAATFWCERGSTLQRLEQRLPVLHEALVAQGLEVVRLAGVEGSPPEPLFTLPVTEALVDERA
jgi:hypothetical protein